jgi:hypothetical protein
MAPEIIVVDDERMIPGAENYTNTDLALARLVKLWMVGLAPKNLYLDHDMGPDNNILDIVQWLCSIAVFQKYGQLRNIQVFVHSMNPVGGQNIVNRLEYVTPFVKRIPIPDQMVTPEDSPVPGETCGAYFGTGDGWAICKRPANHPPISVDKIGHNPYPVPVDNE